jgi:hypothetical protein
MDTNVNVLRAYAVGEDGIADLNTVVGTIAQWGMHPEVTLGYSPVVSDEDCAALGQAPGCRGTNAYFSHDFTGHFSAHLKQLDGPDSGEVLFFSGAIGAQVGPNNQKVWEVTEEFPLTGDGSVVPEGAAIVPKSFRKSYMIGSQLAEFVKRMDFDRVVPRDTPIDWRREKFMTEMTNTLFQIALCPREALVPSPGSFSLTTSTIASSLQEPLFECLVNNGCLKDLDTVSPIEEREGLGACLIQNQCLAVDENGQLDINKLISCVQRIPIVNPQPPCEEFLDTVGAASCVAACPEGDAQCLVGCLLDNATFGQGIETFLACRRPGGPCGDAILGSPDLPVLLGHRLRETYFCPTGVRFPRPEECTASNFAWVKDAELFPGLPDVVNRLVPRREATWAETETIYLGIGPIRIITFPGELAPELKVGLPADFSDNVAKYFRNPDRHATGDDLVLEGVTDMLVGGDCSPDSPCWMFGLTQDQLGYSVPMPEWRQGCNRPIPVEDCAEAFAAGALDYPDAMAGETCRIIAEDSETAKQEYEAQYGEKIAALVMSVCKHGQLTGTLFGYPPEHYEEINAGGWNIAADYINAVERMMRPPVDEIPSGSSSSSISQGAVVGTAVGCAAFAALAGGAWYMKKQPAGGGDGKKNPLTGEEIHAGRSLLQHQV